MLSTSTTRIDAVAVRGPAAPDLRNPACAVAVEAVLRVSSIELSLPQCGFSIGELTLCPGERLALIGRNGAGKSSVIEGLLSLRTQVRARGVLLGHEIADAVSRKDIKRRLGVQLQRTSLPNGMRVSEITSMHRRLFGRSSPSVNEALGIESLRDRRYDWLSKGERQRVDLFMALAHEPELLFLDEPYSGLDAQYALRVTRLIEQMSSTAVLLCCHTREELGLATRVGWIDAGLREQGPPQELSRRLMGDYRLQVCSADGSMDARLEQELGDLVPASRQGRRGPARVYFGGEELREVAARLAMQEGTTIEFGHVELGDLLRHCAQDQ